MGHSVMRLRLDERTVRSLLARDDSAWLGEGVEATSHQEDPMTHDATIIRNCRLCGYDKPRDDFYASKPTYCKPCTTKKINAHIAAINDATRSTAENHRQPWSELEVEMLLAAVAEGMHAKDIAEMLGRTYLAVHGKIEVIRKLLAEGRAVSYIVYETTTTTTKTTVRRENVCPNCHLVRPCFCD